MVMNRLNRYRPRNRMAYSGSPLESASADSVSWTHASSRD